MEHTIPKTEKLTNTERSLRFMADSMPQLVWIARPDGYREYFNQRWYAFTGTSLGECEGEKWSNLVYPTDQYRVLQQWHHAVKTGELYEVEYRLYHAPTQSYRWVIGRAIADRDESGVIKNWYGTSTDIDEQKRAAQIQTFLSNASRELASSLDYTQMLKKVTELGVPAIADWCSVDLYDEKTGFEQVSIAHVDPEKISIAQQFREHYPIHIDDPGGVPLVIRTGKTQFYPRITRDMYETIKNQKSVYEFMLSLNLHSIIIAPIRLNDKVVGGISFVSSESSRYYTKTDLEMAEELAARISLAMTNARLYTDSVQELKERKQLERGLRLEERRVQQLVDINRSKDEFISIASHQLRTPATGVKQYLGMVLEGFAGALDPQQRKLLMRAYESNERQLRIVSDLLKVAQVDAGKVRLYKTNVEINELLRDIIREQQAVFKRRRQTITFSPLMIDQSIYIDHDSIRMVFENIIDNASKYSEENTTVEVTVEDHGTGIRIKVGDHGVGIDPHHRSRLFEKFSRLDNTLSTKVGGTGLGLYWAKKIVDLHNGAIKLSANKPQGTVFTICLPKHEKPSKNVRKVTRNAER